MAPSQHSSPQPSGSDPSSRIDDPETVRQQEERGRSRRTPYVPSGRSESGEPIPAVPHEGFLGRVATSIQLGLAVVLLVVTVWALIGGAVVSATARVPVLGLSVNLGHAVLLGVTALLGAAACASRRWLRRWAIAQAIVYFIVFAFGTAIGLSAPDGHGLGLNGPDHALHGAIAVLGFIVMMLTSARIVEPPPSPPAYPNGRTDILQREHDR